jgi:hypothetical protein
VVNPRALAPLMLTSLGFALPAGDLLNWPDCPPGAPYFFVPDARPAHFQTTPVAGPSGGTCALDVVTGSVFSDANSAGGVAFETPGEVAGNAYTLAFDLQRVKGSDPWVFANEEGDGRVNGLTFEIPASKDRCWHHYEFTAELGNNGPKSVLFVYQGKSPSNQAPVLEEMRIDNMTLGEARRNARLGLVDADSWGGRGDRGECRDGDGDRWPWFPGWGGIFR